jgi:hypothetical protein
MQINGRDTFLYLCVLRAPFRHIQNHHAKIVAGYANRNSYHYPKNYLDLRWSGSQAPWPVSLICAIINAHWSDRKSASAQCRDNPHLHDALTRR